MGHPCEMCGASITWDRISYCSFDAGTLELHECPWSKEDVGAWKFDKARQEGKE